MKLVAVLFTAMVAFTTVSSHFLPPFGKGPLYEDIQYFMDMIPMEGIVEVVLQYAVEDAEFGQMLKYLDSQEFKTMLKEVQAIPEFHNFADYLQENNVYIYDSLNKLNKIIGVPPFHEVLRGKRISGGVGGLFQDVKALISYDLFIHGYVHKMRTSSAFRDFVAHLKSPNHQKFVDALYKNKNFLQVRETIESKGIDYTLIEDIIYTVLGIEFPELKKSSDFYANDELSKDIRDFLKLIDMDKIVEIVLSFLDDDEVQRTVMYLYSDEFHALVRIVEDLPPYQDLVLYLHDAGLEIYGLLQKVHKLIGMEDYVPPKRNAKQLSMNTFANRGGIKGLIDAVVAVLPIEEMKALYQEKMKTSPAFRALIEKLRSPEFEAIINAIYTSPIFLEMRQKAIDAGLVLGPIKKLLEAILGIRLPVPI